VSAQTTIAKLREEKAVLLSELCRLFEERDAQRVRAILAEERNKVAYQRFLDDLSHLRLPVWKS